MSCAHLVESRSHKRIESTPINDWSRKQDGRIGGWRRWCLQQRLRAGLWGNLRREEWRSHRSWRYILRPRCWLEPQAGPEASSRFMPSTSLGTSTLSDSLSKGQRLVLPGPAGRDRQGPAERRQGRRHRTPKSGAVSRPYQTATGYRFRLLRLSDGLDNQAGHVE